MRAVKLHEKQVKMCNEWDLYIENLVFRLYIFFKKSLINLGEIATGWSLEESSISQNWLSISNTYEAL